jgi:hypothetical protein
MPDNRSNGILGLVLGIVVAAGAALFIVTGGDLGGKTTINGDDDLPPVASSETAH